jgi:RHS repeat-associated protein
MIGMRVEHSASGVYMRYFQKDHLNSIAVLTDEAGSVVEQLSYDAWGKRRHAANGADDPAGSITSQTNRGFTGHEQLEEVGLVHMNGRVYDPLIGRFTSADPVTPEPFTTQSWNRYTYAANNPLKFLDPTGHYSLGANGTDFNDVMSWGNFGTGGSSGDGDVNDNGKGDVGTGGDGTEGNEQETGVRGIAYHETEEFARQAFIENVLNAYRNENKVQAVSLKEGWDENPTSYVPKGFVENTTALPNEANPLRSIVTIVRVVRSLAAGRGFGFSRTQKVQDRLTLAQRLADKVQGFPGSMRPNTVAVIKHKNGMITIGRNRGGVHNSAVQNALQKAPKNCFGGQCAEINALSRALDKGRNLDGAKISISNVRGQASSSGIHGTPKAPCNTCSSVLDQYKVKW